jgi:hypothetical protein
MHSTEILFPNRNIKRPFRFQYKLLAFIHEPAARHLIMPFKAAFEHLDRANYRKKCEARSNDNLEAKYHKKTMLLASSGAGIIEGAALAVHTAGLSIVGSVWSGRQVYLLEVQLDIIAEILSARGITVRKRKRDILAGIAISGAGIGIGAGVAEVSFKSANSDTKS